MYFGKSTVSKRPIVIENVGVLVGDIRSSSKSQSLTLAFSQTTQSYNLDVVRNTSHFSNKCWRDEESTWTFSRRDCMQNRLFGQSRAMSSTGTFYSISSRDTKTEKSGNPKRNRFHNYTVWNSIFTALKLQYVY